MKLAGRGGLDNPLNPRDDDDEVRFVVSFMSVLIRFSSQAHTGTHTHLSPLSPTQQMDYGNGGGGGGRRGGGGGGGGGGSNPKAAMFGSALRGGGGRDDDDFDRRVQLQQPRGGGRGGGQGGRREDMTFSVVME